MRSLIFTLTSLFCYFNSVAQHTLLYPVSLKQQEEVSTLIVEAEVISQKTEWNAANNLIYTLNTLKVYKSFKGECIEYITILTLGGSVGTATLYVSESLQLIPNQTGVFLLKSSSAIVVNEEEVYEVVSDLQGFYRYDLSNQRVINPFQNIKGIQTSFYTMLKSATGLSMHEYLPFEFEAMLPSNKSLKTTFSFSPDSISAGTESVVTITGADFGNDPGTVEFKFADDGGITYQPVLESQIQSWTDTEITVEVPTYAGSGTIRITDAMSSSQESPSSLIITFAQSNGESFGDAVLSNLIDQDGTGGYTWHMHTDFDANEQANTEFMEAFNTWKCSSFVNWKLGEATTTDSTVIDGENVIRFDNGDELPMGVLGRCTSYSFLCGTPAVNAIIELDMIIDDGTDYHYGDGTPNSEQYDFQSVVVHELGHGHQLNHVIDSSDIMYYGLADGVIRRTLGTNDISGSNYVQTRCSATATCQFGATSNLACGVVGIQENELDKTWTIFPNPAKEEFIIQGILKDDALKVYNLLGKEMPITIRQESGQARVNCANWPRGIYLIVSEGKQPLFQKIVLE